MKKCPTSILCWGSNPQSSEHESPPKTTRQELPPKRCLKFTLHNYVRTMGDIVNDKFCLLLNSPTFKANFASSESVILIEHTRERGFYENSKNLEWNPFREI